MKVRSLTVAQFRNVGQAAFEPDDGMNVLFGDNAHGKTNLLEAVWLFTGGKSFRGTKDADRVKFGCEQAALAMTFDAGNRTQEAEITIDNRRHATLNGLKQPVVNRLTGHFCAVIFSPDHLSLIKDGPEVRRRFVDAACCQLRPLFLPVLAEYTRVLAQRNRLLKLVRTGTQAMDNALMDTFDARLAHTGAQVRRFRQEYITALSPYADELYEGLSNGRETLRLCYQQEEQESERLLAAIHAARATDLKAGFSTVGPHRDHLEIFLNEKSVRQFGSQGQQRSAVLAMKLAEACLLRDGYGECPVILLDDVMSELDVFRQEYILNHIDGWQVFITCCDPSTVMRLKEGKTFAVKNGTITAGK